MAHAANNTSASLPETYFRMVEEVIYDIPEVQETRVSERSIHKVPSNLRKVNAEAYTPQCISIGPIHFDLDNEELKPMHEHKIRYFDFFWKRVSNEQAMRTYKNYLKNDEKIRQCYPDQLNRKFTDCIYTMVTFTDMILLDAVFIMELLLRNSEWKSDTNSNSKHDQQTINKSFQVRHGDDIILTHSWLGRSITRDLILLENQIPFFVLEKLYKDVVVPCYYKIEEQQTTAGFVDLAIEYFAIFYDTDQMMSSSDDDETKKHYFSVSLFGGSSSGSNSNLMSKYKWHHDEPKHFIDLIRWVYLPITRELEGGWASHVLRTATKLRDSGVSFEKGNEDRALVDITFDKTRILSLFLCFGCLPFKPFKARLRIPQLRVDHNTECVLRNLIAFEQCHYPEKPYFCNYVSFIDSLIHTQLDVDMLVEKEVIVHELGSDEEVATLVNGLGKHVVTNSTIYYKTINSLNDHYVSNWNHTVAALRLAYFRDLWRASGTVVGIFVLLFAVYQFLNAVAV